MTSYEKGQLLFDKKGNTYLIDLVLPEEETLWIKVPFIVDGKWEIKEFNIPFAIADLIDRGKPNN